MTPVRVDAADHREQPRSIRVPFNDLYAQYLSIRVDIDRVMADVIAKSAFIRGPYVEAFEQQFSQTVGARYCVSCGNGTDALFITMRALDVKPGDEVITSAHSWISSAETISQAGGRVVFCDTDADTFTLDVRHLTELITPRTVGIIPVHLYGQAAEMSTILALAGRHGLWVIEDCAQAHLATYMGRTVGTLGTAGCYSFYPGKNLGAMGDAGAIVTDDAELAHRMALFARHGGLSKGEHEIEGINSRMDGLQAAVLGVKLRHLRNWTQSRQTVAAAYDEELCGLNGIETPKIAPGREHVYHHYVIRNEQRDSLARYLHANGVQTMVNYPVALPFLKAYAYLDHDPEDFPNAHADQSRILSLPMFPEITHTQISHVLQSVRDFLRPR